MNPRDFCNWFQGVLDMAENEDGSVSFSKIQAAKINPRLKEALKSEDAPQHPSCSFHPNRPPGARC